MEDLKNMTTEQLWRRVRTGGWKESTLAADEMERRMPGLSVTNLVARKCIEKAQQLDPFSYIHLIHTLKEAAAEIDSLQYRIEQYDVLEKLRKLDTPTRGELLKERDELRAANRKCSKTIEMQDALIRALRDVNADLDRQRYEGGKDA